MKFFILAAFITISLASEQHCPRACPKIYEPVCAKSTDGIYKTFVNLCELEIQNCEHQETGYEFMKNGQCFDHEMNTNCPEICLDNFDPVCAKSGNGKLITFPNMCEFTRYTCQNRNNEIQLLGNGKCSIEAKKTMECPVACTKEFKPICAKSNNGEMETFSNMCEFEMYKCKNGNLNLQILREGSCSVETGENMGCPMVCTKEYNPICAKSINGEMKTFSNMCEFEMYKCKNGNLNLQILREGSCSVETRKDMRCPMACTKEYNPICAKSSNGEMKTFSNMCELEMYKCQNGNTDLQILTDGPCSVASMNNCPVACTDDYIPVCIQFYNGEMKTFSNMCDFRMYTCETGKTNIQMLRRGPCSVETKKNMKCPKACTKEYNPVCTKSINGEMKTFSNMCQFQIYTCNHVQSGFHFFKNGQC